MHVTTQNNHEFIIYDVLCSLHLDPLIHSHTHNTHPPPTHPLLPPCSSPGGVANVRPGDCRGAERDPGAVQAQDSSHQVGGIAQATRGLASTAG